MLAPSGLTPSPLFVRPLVPSRIAQAFPLIAACDPTVSFEAWRSRASDADFIAGNRRAVFSAETPGDRIRGVCLVSAGTHADGDLLIEQFALCRLGRHAIAKALLRNVVVIATEWQCPGVRMAVSVDAGWVAGFLVEAGCGAITRTLLRAALGSWSDRPLTTKH